MVHAILKVFFQRILILTAATILSLSVATAQSSDVTPPAAALAPPPAPAQETSQPPVTVLEDTLIRVRTNEPLNSKRVKEGSPVRFMVSESVFVGDVLAIPLGATVHGVVIKSKQSGVLTGSPELELKLVSLNLGGRSYQLDSYHFNVKGASKTKPTETKALRGAEVGAVAGSLVGGVSSKGGVVRVRPGNLASMGTDAAIGAGVGTLVSAVTPGPGIWFPSESQVDFFLAAPVTVTPVSAKEAARMAQGLHPGGPTLYLRGDTP
jgi:hypothetical protein